MINVNYLTDKFGTIDNILDKSSFKSNVLVKNSLLVNLIDNIFSQVFGWEDITYEYFQAMLISDPDTNIRYTMCSQKGEKEILVVAPFVIDKASIPDEKDILRNTKNIVDTIECEGRRYTILIPFLDDDYKMRDLALGLTEFFAQAYGGIKDGFPDMDSVMHLLKALCIVSYIMRHSKKYQDDGEKYSSTSTEFMISISEEMIDKVHYAEEKYANQNLIYKRSKEYAEMMDHLMELSGREVDLYDYVEINGLQMIMAIYEIPEAATFKTI